MSAPLSSSTTTDFAALAGRLLISALFLLSGLAKLTAPAFTIGYIQSVGLPFPQAGYAIALLVEIGGGALLILGLQTRIVALVMAIFTIAAALAFHNKLGDQNTFIHFFKNVSIAGGLLQVVAFGGGRFSLDGRKLA